MSNHTSLNGEHSTALTPRQPYNAHLRPHSHDLPTAEPQTAQNNLVQLQTDRGKRKPVVNTVIRMFVVRAVAVLALLACGAREARCGVVGDFNHVERCKDSLFMGTPPRGYLSSITKKICQRYEDRPRYVTLYDPRKHIPVYSAYTFKKSDGEKKVDFPWMFEPQLASEKGSSNMEPFPQSSSMHMNFEDSQAVLEDYADVVQYERGHLNPDEHQAEPLDKASTYTLTNVVPQIREFSVGPWAQHQDLIRKRLNNYCRGKAYLVTGVTTSGNMIRRDNIDRVAIPEYMWTAYCCTDFDQNAPYFVRYKFPAFGAYGLNDRVNNHMVEVPLKNMERFLRGRMDVDKNFQIFYNDCVPDL